MESGHSVRARARSGNDNRALTADICSNNFDLQWQMPLGPCGTSLAAYASIEPETRHKSPPIEARARVSGSQRGQHSIKRRNRAVLGSSSGV